MSLHIASLIAGASSSSYHAAAVTIFSLFFLTGLLYLLRQWLLPEPIPGIPYNPEAARSLLGDIMAIQREMPDNISEWVVRQSARHRSPVYQVFLVPFSRPFVVVSDFREAHDILVRRGIREFDRSDLAIALLRGEMPNFHACLKTGPVWAAHRRLLQDVMSPAFLHGVAAPMMHAGACRLLALWRRKREIAGDGVPFAAAQDLSYATFDAICDFGYGECGEERALAEQIKLVDSLSEAARRAIRANAAPGQPVEFPVAPLSPAMDAVLRTTENITKVAVTGFPGMAWRVLSWFPRVRRLRALKDAFIKSQVDKAIKRLDNTNPEDGYSKLKCALDLIIQRERTLAEKEGRDPVYWSDSIKDEMFGFVTGGHETSANVLAWGVKFLADNPTHQTTLRNHLRAAHPSAVAEGRVPTHDEITARSVPFLLATVEEILRLAHAVAMVDRQCTEDTVILGHAVPKGTTVVLVNKGPGFTAPSLPIQESHRSASSQKAALEQDGKGCFRVLDEEGMDVFDPRRWLVASADDPGREEFDPAAYPSLPFGLGQRGCFGRRMVYVQFKQLLTLLVWQFAFLPCPPALSSYDSVQVLTNKPRKCYVALKEL